MKTNDSLEFAVLTGCMRISKESIFIGLNNLKVLSVADMQFYEYFGFTDSEVRELLKYYELSLNYEDVKEWYDGYRFGNVEVYCPGMLSTIVMNSVPIVMLCLRTIGLTPAVMRW